MNYRASERKAMLASTEKAASAIHASMEMAESRSRKATANFAERSR